LSGGLTTALSVEMLRRRIGLSWGAIGRAVWPAFPLTIMTAGPVGIIDFLSGPMGYGMWTTCIAGGLAATLSWLGGIGLLRHPLWNEILLVGRSFGRPPRHRTADRL
jgi:hypothetical protein